MIDYKKKCPTFFSRGKWKSKVHGESISTVKMGIIQEINNKAGKYAKCSGGQGGHQREGVKDSYGQNMVEVCYMHG